jgi:hypothetical protein
VSEKKIDPVQRKKHHFFFAIFRFRFFGELKKKIESIFAAGKLKAVNHNKWNTATNQKWQQAK